MNGCGFIPLIFYNSPLVIAVAAARAIADAAVQGHDAGHKSVVFFFGGFVRYHAPLERVKCKKSICHHATDAFVFFSRIAIGLHRNPGRSLPNRYSF